MKYRVKGAIRDTAEEVEIDVTATSDYEAMAIASKLKLLVESVEAIIQPKAKTVPACQGCGVVIESQGFLRVIDDQCFCRECFGKRLAVADNHRTPLAEQEVSCAAALSSPVSESEKRDTISRMVIVAQSNNPTWSRAECWRWAESHVTAESQGKVMGAITLAYDKFNDVTTAFARTSCHRAGYSWRGLDVRALFPGRVQAAPIDSVRMSLRFSSNDAPLFPKRLQTDLILLLDGKRVTVKIDEWLKNKQPDDHEWTDYEVNFSVKQPLLSDLRIAGEIHGRLVNETMDLTNVIHSALGALAQAVKFQDVATPR